MVRAVFVALIGGWALSAPVQAQNASPLNQVRASVRALSRFVDVRKPILIEFTLENLGDRPVTLSTSHPTEEAPETQMGLPLAHLFSGKTMGGVQVVNVETGRPHRGAMARIPTSRGPDIVLAPRGTVGRTIDLTQHFPPLLPGRFRLIWEPYEGALTSNAIYIDIMPLKQAEITTDAGAMTLQFYYDDAPETVRNFIELADLGFYNNTYFHRIEPGHLIIGGCPLGDGTGVRSDGKKIDPEFNEKPHQKGSVSMALIPGDPRSASCQFFICNTRHPEWDGQYTVFGQLVGDESMATLDRLMTTPIDADRHPTRSLVIRSIRIINAPLDISSGEIGSYISSSSSRPSP